MLCYSHPYEIIIFSNLKYLKLKCSTDMRRNQRIAVLFQSFLLLLLITRIITTLLVKVILI